MIRNALIGMYREIENLIQLVYFCGPNQIISPDIKLVVNEMILICNFANFESFFVPLSRTVCLEKPVQLWRGLRTTRGTNVE